MTICGRCGATTTDDAALFCGICGAPLAAGKEFAAPLRPAENPGTVRPPAGEAPPQPPPIAPALPIAGAPSARAKGTIPAAPISAAVKPIPDPVVPKGVVLAPPAGAEKPFKPPKHLPEGALVDKKYAVLRVLGEGGMGVVYLARDIHTGLEVVVKAVRSELAHREDVRARTLAEGRALAQIDHPNVVHLRAVAVEGPSLYLVMQYIEGESLDKIIGGYSARGEKMPVEEALAVFRQIAAGVGAAHQEGVVHRDLKPANVIVRRKDRVAKVTDFGIALVPNEPDRPHTRGILGSLWYMSPEQVTGRRDLDHRVDVYALGILLYQLLVGRVPFDAKSDYDIMKAHAELPMPMVSSVRADVPAAVDEVIQRATAKDRDQRFQRCEELIAAVDRILGAGPVTTLPGVSAEISRPGGTPAGVTPIPATVTASGSRPGVIEDDAAPVVPRRRVWPWVAAALLLVGGGAGAALGFGLVPGVAGIWKVPRLGASASAEASAGAPPAAPSGSASAPPAKPSGLAALTGTWVGNGRELDAVMAGGDLEFRVKKPEQFAPQGYLVGEARFALRPTAEGDVYAVEDRIRPVPPVGKSYDPRSRGTCQEVWTAVGSDPLRARYDGTRLTVEFAKIEPGPGNFTSEGAKVTSCVGLRALRASKVVSVLKRP